MENVICFHNPDEENGYLSNWYLSDFTADGVQFSSMEQYMMYQKAMLFSDTEIAAKILQTTDVSKIKALGRAVRNYENLLWNGIRQICIYRGLLAKFRQNPDLLEKLLATENALLAECAVHDQIWGIGLSMTSKDRFDLTKWRGQNLLGFALMQTRDTLRETE